MRVAMLPLSGQPWVLRGSLETGVGHGRSAKAGRRANESELQKPQAKDRAMSAAVLGPVEGSILRHVSDANQIREEVGIELLDCILTLVYFIASCALFQRRDAVLILTGSTTS